MTVDTALPPTVLRSTAPATGLFGGGKPAPQDAAPHVAAPHIAAAVSGEPASPQRKSFSDLFRADLHAA